MKRLMLALGLLSLTACVEVTDIEEPTVATPLAASPSISVVALPEPNQYQVNLSMPEGTQSVVRREVSASGFPLASEVSIPMLVAEGVLADQNPQAGSTYEYLFGYIDQGRFQLIRTVRVEIPKDLLISGVFEINELNAKETKQYNRLFFEKNSVLRTNGFKTVFNVAEVIADNATIETFADNAKAAVGVNGRSGGEIEINSQKAMGELRVFLRGENGGDGAPGAAHSIAKKGMDALTGCGGGKKGSDGIKGNDGQRGSRGGNSGKLQIQIAEKNELNLIVEKVPGLGGKGGAAGPGQKGGIGGTSPNCPFYSPGPRGADGPDGMNGSQGPDGEIE